MKLQVLLSCMHQTDHSIIQKSNIQSHAVIVNQCDMDSVEILNQNGVTIKFISTTTRGVGISRNTAILHSDQDILLFADDDVCYVDGYEQMILREFENHPDADVIFFDFDNESPRGHTKKIHQFHRTSFHSALKYGTIRIAIKRASLLRARLSFSLLFGGGAKFGCGEDSNFIADVFRHKMVAYASPVAIGTMRQSESTWFRGYSEKYFRDRGALWQSLVGGVAPLYCLQHLLRHSNEWKTAKYSLFYAWKLMMQGCKEYKN